MKHNKLIAALAAAGGLFAMSGAHAIAPAAAVGLAALGGAVAGATAAATAPPTVAVVPANPTVVMGGPPAVVQEVIPAPRDGYAWTRGHYEIRNGVSTWVPGHWTSTDTSNVIIIND